MSTQTSLALGPRRARAATHVEASRSSGSSPGASYTQGVIRPRLHLDRHGSAPVPVAWQAHGPASAPAVVVLGGISAGRRAGPTPLDPSPGWWPGVVGPGLALDPRRHRLVGIDWLGGPGSGWKPRAPVTTRDQARAVSAVLDHLGVGRAVLVGASYGGMVALALAASEPRAVEGIVLLCSAHRTHPLATAVRVVQRGILRLGSAEGRAAEAVALARALAMITYRTPEEFDERFSHRADEVPEDAPTFPVQRYLEAVGGAFARRFDADAFRRLSESIDLHDVDPADVKVPTTLVSVDSDALVPPWLADELACRLPALVRHVRLTSHFGHDAFLKEVEAVSAVLGDTLGRGEVVR